MESVCIYDVGDRSYSEVSYSNTVIKVAFTWKQLDCMRGMSTDQFLAVLKIESDRTRSNSRLRDLSSNRPLIATAK